MSLFDQAVPGKLSQSQLVALRFYASKGFFKATNIDLKNLTKEEAGKLLGDIVARLKNRQKELSEHELGTKEEQGKKPIAAKMPDSGIDR